ncbi:hypothetical protein BDN72DRAFT_881486 [Pluteus cervinus]|uniref:Uncharacterized protein n=1 Tax=Pluteus cervinus TaxID=181527 RepID=A0ACD3AFZ4_9AGAR|nr:hypothetical protein BDN72DRAFT_881486 [Pluteus cervinus]
MTQHGAQHRERYPDHLSRIPGLVETSGRRKTPKTHALSVLVAAAALYLYDWFLTIDLEVAFIWPSKLSAIKVLYLLQRYMPLFDTVALVLSHPFIPILSVDTCAHAFQTACWLFLFGILTSEVILTRRCIAVWGNTKRNLYIFLSLLAVLCWIPCIVFLELYLQSLTFVSLPYPGLYCFTAEGSNILYLCWILVAVYDAGTMSVMMISGLRNYSPECRESTLFRVVYRDGALYYLYMFILSTLNVIIALTLPSGYATLLTSLERVVHSVLTSRVVLHIRELTHNRELHRGRVSVPPGSSDPQVGLEDA